MESLSTLAVSILCVRVVCAIKIADVQDLRSDYFGFVWGVSVGGGSGKGSNV